MFNVHGKMGDVHEYESAFVVLVKNPDREVTWIYIPVG